MSPHCSRTAFNARFWKLLFNAGGLSFLGRLMSPCVYEGFALRPGPWLRWNSRIGLGERLA